MIGSEIITDSAQLMQLQAVKPDRSKLRSLISLFITWIASGFVIGAAISTLVFSDSLKGAALLSAAFSYGWVGAAVGLLIAGLYDVVFSGDLEDRPDCDD